MNSAMKPGMRISALAGSGQSLWWAAGCGLFEPWTLFRNGDPVFEMAGPIPLLAAHGDTAFFVSPNGAGFVREGEIEEHSFSLGECCCVTGPTAFFVDRSGEFVVVDVEKRSFSSLGVIEGIDVRRIASNGTDLVAMDFAGNWYEVETSEVQGPDARCEMRSGGKVSGPKCLGVWDGRLVAVADGNGWPPGKAVHDLGTSESVPLGEQIHFVDAVLSTPSGDLLIAAASSSGLDSMGRRTDLKPPRLWQLSPDGSLELLVEETLEVPQRRGAPFAVVDDRIAFARRGADSDEIVWIE